MAENKTQPTDSNINAFIETITDDQKRQDCFTLISLMQEVTGQPAQMWGDTIVGFDQYHYKYASGREGDSFLTGFSPRKQNLTIYIMGGFDQFADLMEKIGKHKHSVSCLYVKSLKDIDLDVLRELVSRSVAYMRATYPA